MSIQVHNLSSDPKRSHLSSDSKTPQLGIQMHRETLVTKFGHYVD